MGVYPPAWDGSLGGFQYQVTRQLTGRIPRRRLDRRLEYTLVQAAREETGFKPMDTYIRKSHNTVARYIATRPILDLCEAAERRRGGTGRGLVVVTGGT